MKLYCLSSQPNKPCYVFRFKGITVMLDCGLSEQTALNFMPLPLVPSSRLANVPPWLSGTLQLKGELKDCSGRPFIDSIPEFCPPLDGLVDYAEIDVILISNYYSMLALPFITEGTGFKGVVYATGPTLQCGKLLMEELVELMDVPAKKNQAVYWKDLFRKLPPPLCNSSRPKIWSQLYSLTEVNRSLARVKGISHGEKLDVYGTLTVTAVSSGFCLGSSNWVITSDYEKIVYVSGSSTLKGHSKPMDESLLMDSNVLILAGLTQTPSSNPDKSIGEMASIVATTLRKKGSVLIPCYPTGVVYDLFEYLANHLDTANMGTTPMFFISPVAEESLGYSNIFSEWLCADKQNKAYLLEQPFLHGDLAHAGRLKCYKRTYSDGFYTDFVENDLIYMHERIEMMEEGIFRDLRFGIKMRVAHPCIVFCGHPSLRFGEALNFIEMWGSSSLNTVIFTEPDFRYMDALAPFQPLQMKAVYCPIDLSLTFGQANKLMSELRPNTLVVPEPYTKPPPAHPHRSDFVIDQKNHFVTPISRGNVVNMQVKSTFVKASLDPVFADQINTCEVQPGISLATINAALHVKDNRVIITALPEDPCIPPDDTPAVNRESTKAKQYEWGTLDVHDLVRKLQQNGFDDAELESHDSGHLIRLPGSKTVIELTERTSHVRSESSDNSVRLRIRSILMQCLNSF